MIDGVDINLSAEQLSSFIKRENVHLYNNYDNLKDYDLILLCDILEHVKDDNTFLTDIVKHYLVPGGYILITVPAFQFLSSSHDDFLGHFRRYNLMELNKLIEKLAIHKISGGYLFFSLLPFRFFRLFLERYFPGKIKMSKGVGRWNGSEFVSQYIESILIMDAYFSLALTYFKIKLPGLSAWILCQKQLL